MRRLARQLLPLLLLCSLPHLTLAEDEDSAAPADTAEAEAAPSEASAIERMPLPERSEVDSQALQRQLELKEQQQLQAGEDNFLALWLPANTSEPNGAVILLPGDNESADWPQVIGPLRRKLPDAGWHSLSITLPDPNSEAPPLRQAQAQAQSSLPATDEATDENSAPDEDAAATEEVPEPADATAEDPDVRRTTHAERVMARIEAAIALAEQQQAQRIVLLGHGSGAYWAARYLQEREPAAIKHLLLVSADLPAGYSPALDELIPSLKLPTGDFYYKDQLADRQAASRRMQASKRQQHPGYVQVAMKALPGNREAEQEQLHRRIRGWLTQQMQAK